MKDWKTLIPLLEKHEACSEFVAECVYAYIVNYGTENPGDSHLLYDLVQFLKDGE